jgi:DNA-binding MarR family transcriptional regulator
MRTDRVIEIFEEPESGADAALDLSVLSQHLEFIAHRALLHLRRELIQQGGVRPIAFNALTLIGANPGVTQSELAEALALDKGTAAHLSRELEEQGWIERRHRESDRRWKGVYLSPRGVQELERLKQKVSPVMERVRTLYTEPEYRLLTELLGRLAPVAASRG